MYLFIVELPDLLPDGVHQLDLASREPDQKHDTVVAESQFVDIVARGTRSLVNALVDGLGQIGRFLDAFVSVEVQLPAVIETDAVAESRRVGGQRHETDPDGGIGALPDGGARLTLNGVVRDPVGSRIFGQGHQFVNALSGGELCPHVITAAVVAREAGV